MAPFRKPLHLKLIILESAQVAYQEPPRRGESSVGLSLLLLLAKSRFNIEPIGSLSFLARFWFETGSPEFPTKVRPALDAISSEEWN
jgi:hypothetical protein